MSYTTGIIGGITKSIHTSMPNVDSNGTYGQTVWEESFDFSNLSVGDGYRLTFQITAVSNSNNKQAYLVLNNSITVLQTGYSYLKNGVEMVIEVRKYDTIRCFVEGTADSDTASTLIGTHANNDGAQSNIDYFKQSTNFQLRFDSIAVSDLTLALAKVETITSK